MTMQSDLTISLPRAEQADAEITFGKLVMDKLVALTALLLLAPVMLAIALAIRVTEGGPVFYAHSRVGAGGRTFGCLKFRTMYPEASSMLDEVLRSDPIAREEWESSFKLSRDHRVTPIGRILRRSSLDELPQFINVLRGDMSIVGPRPVTQKEASLYGAHFDTVFSVRPGVTGLWQVSGRSDISYEGRVALDLSYVRSVSLGRDLKILMRTFSCVLLRRGAV